MCWCICVCGFSGYIFFHRFAIVLSKYWFVFCIFAALHSRTKIAVVSYAKYCRYRATLKRLENVADDWLRNTLVEALGGFTSSGPDTRVVFCKVSAHLIGILNSFAKIRIYFSVGNLWLPWAGDTRVAVQSFSSKAKGTSSWSPKEDHIGLNRLPPSRWFTWQWVSRFWNFGMLCRESLLEVLATLC